MSLGLLTRHSGRACMTETCYPRVVLAMSISNLSTAISRNPYSYVNEHKVELEKWRLSTYLGRASDIATAYQHQDLAVEHLRAGAEV